MTAGTVPALRAPVVRSGALLPLAAQEARRILLHPVSLFGWAMFAVTCGTLVVHDQGPRNAFEAVDTIPSFFPGVLLILAAYLVATRDERADSREMLAAAPLPVGGRTAALLLASLVPAVTGLTLILVLHVALLGSDRYVVAPGPWHLVQAPITFTGAVLLGVLTARWLPHGGGVLLVIVVMVTVNARLNNDQDLQYFGPAMGWARWGYDAQSWGGMYPGSPAWRCGYLAGLCALAALGSLLPVVRRRGAVVAAGPVALGWTVLAGWRMLP